MELKFFLNSTFKNPQTAKILFAISIFIGIFFLALKPSTDPDLFWHLKTGELMWQYQTIPHADWFSYTMSDYPYIDLEWLTELIMFFIWKISGFGGLAIFFALIIALTFGYFIPKSITGGSFFITRLLALLGAFISSPVFGSRPQMFSLLGLSILLFIIFKLKENNQNRLVWLLPPVFLLWSNMHGGFVFGIGFMIIFLILENFLIKQKDLFPNAKWLKTYDPLIRKSWKKITRLFAVSVALTFLNPYSWRIYEELYKSLSDMYNKSVISEWLAPNFHTTEGIMFGFYIIFIFIVMAMMKKIDLLSFVLIPLVLFFAFGAIRNIPFFVIIALPFLARSLAGMENIFSDLMNKKFIAFAAAGLLIFYLPTTDNIQSAIKTFNNSREQAKSGGYPDQALDFLLNKPEYREKNILNEYGWGGYIIGNDKCRMTNDKKMQCEPGVFIDGRMDYWKLADKHILKDYMDIEYFSEDWEKIMDRYDIQILFLNKNTVFAKALKFNNNWKNIYEDDLAVIYEKK